VPLLAALGAIVRLVGGVTKKMTNSGGVKRLKLFLRSYSIFWTLTLSVAIGGFIYEIRSEQFSLDQYALVLFIIVLVFVVSALPFDIWQKKKDKILCGHLGISYEDFVFKPANEKDSLRASFKGNSK